MRVLVLYKHKHIGRFWICISVSLITKIIIVFLNRVFQWTISRYVKSDHFHCFNFIYCSTSRIYLFPLFTWRKIIFSLHNMLLAHFWRKGFQNYFISYTPSQPRLGVMCVPMLPLFFFYSKIRNFAVLPKWTFVFLQRNTKIHSCTQTSIRFSHRNTKFRIVPFILWLRNTKFLKLFRNGHLIFANNLTNLKLRPNWYSFFFTTKCKIWIRTQTAVCFLTTNKRK